MEQRAEDKRAEFIEAMNAKVRWESRRAHITISTNIIVNQNTSGREARQEEEKESFVLEGRRFCPRQ